MTQHSTPLRQHSQPGTHSTPINRRLFPGDDRMDVDGEDVFGGQDNLPPPPPTPPPPPPPPPSPPTPSRRDPARNVGGRRYSNARRPSNAGQSSNKYCSTGRHNRPHVNFIENGRTYQTCNDCRARQRQSRANQGPVNHDPQALQQLEQQEIPPLSTSPSPPPDPLLSPAVSPEDHNRLQRVRAKWNAIQLESCDGCEREWFDLNVKRMATGNNLCKDCRKEAPIFHKNNNMYPGPGCPDLPLLTQMEEMLISPVHALIQVCD